MDGSVGDTGDVVPASSHGAMAGLTTRVIAVAMLTLIRGKSPLRAT